ncbi:MAG: molybdopterin-dependent oxidoreductase [Parvibaculaceae bacterium]
MMASGKVITRRAALVAGFGGAALLIGNANKLSLSPSFANAFHAIEDWTQTSQRTLLLPSQLAKEYSASDVSPVFKPNGTTNPGTDDYNRHVAQNFANWRLTIDGMVARPMSLSVAELRRLPARTQITRHDCVEGWSAIGMWSGVQLGLLLKAAGVASEARYAVFHCADNLTGEPAKGGEQSPGQYYESVDLTDAFHPQTIVAYAMNGMPLDVAHGAPLRLRVERQLGYKHAKYLQRIEITDSFARIAGGRGGYWEDRGYEWYAGI